MPRLKDQAICIRLSDWSESSQIVTLLTQTQGKVRGLAKGSRRLSPSSIARYSGGFELLTAGQIVGSSKPTTDLATLTEWDLQQPFPHFRRNLHTQQLALLAADLCNALLADHEPHARSHDALFILLQELAAPQHAAAALLRFLWALLCDTGYQPELSLDTATRQPLGRHASYLFDAKLGGFTPARSRDVSPEKSAASTNHTTAASAQGPWLVRAGTLDLLRHIAAAQPLPQSADDTAITRASRLLCVYCRAILDRELPTMRFLLEP